MTPLPEALRPLGWSEPGRTTLEIATGGWRTRRPAYVEATAPCRAACPAGEPIAQWIERARRGEWAEAWRLIREENPFPAVMGRVCGHPCEAACNRRGYDGAIAINALERFVGDWGLAHGTAAPAAVTRRERVAIAGAGPAGLTCAYHLARLGYRVTVFEAQPRPGGLLRYGIPEYRLPRAVLEREVDLILALGVEVLTGRRLGADVGWDELAAWDAVFVATGAALPLALDVPGESASRIRDGVGFLREVATGSPPPLGDRVVVVGGGSTAMDVARTARRLGARSVTVLALEERAAMPALPEEVAQALAEGIEIIDRVCPAGFVVRDGAVAGVSVARAHFVVTAEGAVRPLLEEGPRRMLEADDVLVAIGQRADLAVLEPAVRAAAGLVVTDADGATSAERVWAGGDVASRRRTVAEAVGAGTRAARAIHGRLGGGAPGAWSGAHPWVEARPAHVVAPSEVRPEHFPHATRAHRWERPEAQRVQSFVEVVTGLAERAARDEAERCFTCGRCVGCDVCLEVCPDVAIARVDGAYRVSAEHCKGCGLCAAECPRGALIMVEVPRSAPPRAEGVSAP